MKVCLFDIDGTLISTGGAGRAALVEALCSAFDVPHDAVPHVNLAGRTDRSIITELFERMGIEWQDQHWQQFQSAYLEALPRCLTACEGRVLPSVVEALESLGERQDVAIGLLTGNVRKGAALKLKHYGLDHHFTWGGFGDLHTDRNHVAHEALATVQEHLGKSVAADQIWVIGDTPADVACARAIGARVVAVATGIHDVPALTATNADLVLKDFSDWNRMVQAW